MMKNIARAAVPYLVALSLGIAIVFAASSLSRTSDLSGTPLSETTVVAVLQGSGQVYSQSLQAAIKAARDRPDDIALAKAVARALIAEGRNAGDSRLVGAALSVLRPQMVDPDAETLHLAATARQYQHDFPGALALLDEALRHNPGMIDALLSRAFVQMVQGRFDLAAPDCEAIYALQRPDLGFLCEATNQVLSADAPAIAQRIEAVLTRPEQLEPSLHLWARSLLGEIAVLQGEIAAAEHHLSAVLQADPLALRERLMLTDLFLATNRPAQAAELVADAVPADGVLIRRVLVARALGQDATKEIAELTARFARNIELGITAHAREEALYFLRVAEHPPMALDRALVNWALQHEIEDAQLLVDAAVLAGRPEAAAPVVRWMSEQGVVVPTFRLPDAVREEAR